MRLGLAALADTEGERDESHGTGEESQRLEEELQAAGEGGAEMGGEDEEQTVDEANPVAVENEEELELPGREEVPQDAEVATSTQRSKWQRNT